MTREHKLALVVGFGLILFVGILLSDHLRRSTQAHETLPSAAANALWTMPDSLEPREPIRLADAVVPPRSEPATAPTQEPAHPARTIDLVAPASAPATITLVQARTEEAAPAIQDATPRTIPTPLPGVPRAPSFATHTISEGETLQDISMSHFGTTRRWEEIASLNDISRPERIRPGMKLRLPGVETSRPVARANPVASTGNTTYQVREGDTLMGISRKTLGSTRRWVDIRDLNNIEDASTLQPGRTLRIPAR